MNMSLAVADGLRRIGIDVTTTADAGLLGTEDSDQIAYGLAQSRVIFTEDADFLVWAGAGAPHAGVIYCHQQTRSIGQVVCALELVWQVYEPDERVTESSSSEEQLLCRGRTAQGTRLRRNERRH